MLSVHQPHLICMLACMPFKSISCILNLVCLACMFPQQSADIAFPSM